MEKGKITSFYLSHVVRKPVFGVTDKDPHKPGCTATEDGRRFEMLDLGCRESVVSMLHKTKALKARTSSAHVFAYAKSMFSHGEANIHLATVST